LLGNKNSPERSKRIFEERNLSNKKNETSDLIKKWRRE